MQSDVMKRAQFWSSDAFDDTCRQAVKKMIANDEALLNDSFYKQLEFGTGGMRGKMGVGTNRINDYTIRFATQGLAAYVNKSFSGTEANRVAIAYDSRNNSKTFARSAAETLASNGIKVYLYKDLRPTPLLSFAVRHLNCQAGIVITASHNPKEYNGYKVYWNDGGQLVPPHDSGVIEEVRKVSSPTEVKSDFDPKMIVEIGKEVDQAYLEACLPIYRLPQDHPAKSSLKISFTSLHGTGTTMVPAALKHAGFSLVDSVETQDEPNGDFPTVDSPNPEEQSAMAMGLEHATKNGSDVLFGTDPDADRVGMAVQDDEGKMTLLNGNEAASLLIYFLLEMNKVSSGVENGFIAKTIVTTELLQKMATGYNVPCYETLTGFKYIAELIKRLEGKETFIGGGEESYGYLIGDAVRDKDAVISTVMLCEMAAWAKSMDKTPFQLLKEVRQQFGFYKEALVSLVKDGQAGAEEIKDIMTSLREDTPTEFAGSKVITLYDHSSTKIVDIQSTVTAETGLPKSNVLQFLLADGSKITARPSGTEPKIKYYISVNAPLETISEHDQVNSQLLARIEEIKSALGV